MISLVRFFYKYPQFLYNFQWKWPYIGYRNFLFKL